MSIPPPKTSAAATSDAALRDCAQEVLETVWAAVGFPSTALAAAVRARLALPHLSKADWVPIGALTRT